MVSGAPEHAHQLPAHLRAAFDVGKVGDRRSLADVINVLPITVAK
jgi:hypothetical protein